MLKSKITFKVVNKLSRCAKISIATVSCILWFDVTSGTHKVHTQGAVKTSW